MSSADRKGAFVALAGWLQTWPSRYGLALITVCAAVATQEALEHAIGFSHSFLLFYPTIFIVSLLAGFWPGATATLLAVVAAEYFYRGPGGRLTLSDETEQMGLALFAIVGIALSWVADSLRQRTNRLREFEKVVEGLEEMIVVVDRNQRYLIANRAFLQYRGMTRQKVIGRHAAEVLDQAVFESKVKEKLEECFGGKVVHYEMTYPEHGDRQLMIDYLPIQGQGGIDRVACVMRDVTNQQKAEHALRLFRTLIDHSNDAVEVIDPLTLRFLDVNDKACSDLGYTREELLDMTVSDIDSKDRHLSTTEFLEDLRNKGSVITESTHQRKDGSTFPVEVSVKYVQFERSYLVTVARDITDRKKAETALRESEDRYRDLIEHTEDLVCTHDLTGRLLSVNRAPARMLGYEVSELLNTPMRDLIAPEFRANFDQYLDRIRCTGADRGLLCVLAKNGQRRIWEYRNSLRTEGVLHPIVRGIAHDVTERKQAEGALRRSEENYRNFVAQSTEGIFRQDIDAPIPIDLPEDELVHRILYDSYMAECNDTIVKMYGLNSVQDFVGRRLIEFVDPKNPCNLELTRDFVRSGFRIVDRESYETDVQGNAKVFRNSMIGIVEEGKLTRSWGIQRDVTDHVRLERARREAVDALRQSEERFRVALHDSPITVFNQDRDLRYTWMYNPQLYWHQDMLGKTDDEIIGPKKAAALNALNQRVLSSGLGAREDVAIVQNGTSYVFDITVEPLFDVEKKVIGITAACIDIARLREIADRLQESRDRLANQKSYLENQIQTELGFEEIIGQSAALREVLKKARVVAPTDSSVLLLGETGTGKELIARSIHALSSRNANTFVKLNCAAVPSGLLESELFGHEKGAYTGAVNQKVGRIELADKGTLFLDEIGEMSPELQPKLLRVLQDREFERLGGIRTLHVDVRIISATNRDLRQDIADKKFREDLFYRLNVFPIELPPLRERRDDIPMLVQHFLRKYSTRMGRRIETIPEDSMRILRNWSWPGNVRELENMIERMVILSKGSVLAPPPAELSEAEFTPEDNLTDMEREHILRILRETNGVLSGDDGAASRLGLKRTTLQSMIKRLGIEPHEYRDSGATGTFAR